MHGLALCALSLSWETGFTGVMVFRMLDTPFSEFMESENVWSSLLINGYPAPCGCYASFSNSSILINSEKGLRWFWSLHLHILRSTPQNFHSISQSIRIIDENAISPAGERRRYCFRNWTQNHCEIFTPASSLTLSTSDSAIPALLFSYERRFLFRLLC